MMRDLRVHPFRSFAIVVAILFGMMLIFVLLPIRPKVVGDPLLGFTYSVSAAEYLGLDPKQTFEQSVMDLRPELVRLPLYWDRIEAVQGTYNWAEIDAQMDFLQSHDTQALLAIGHKLPRWPECHLPSWLDANDVEASQQALMSLLKAAAKRYKDHPSLYAWQVENEALFAFGDCPSWSNDRDLLKKEIQLVKGIDTNTPVFTSDSGEMSLWWRTTSLPVDGISISLYRVVYNKSFIHWPVNPYYYKLRKAIVHLFNKRFIISELQTEPWGSGPVDMISNEEIEQSFPVEALQERIDFARAIQADAILAWGVEWWYYRGVTQGDNRYWEQAKQVFNPHGR